MRTMFSYFLLLFHHFFCKHMSSKNAAKEIVQNISFNIEKKSEFLFLASFRVHVSKISKSHSAYVLENDPPISS